jgi:hypothetical protein
MLGLVKNGNRSLSAQIGIPPGESQRGSVDVKAERDRDL